ncbi:MAG TPA: hypothetical protein PK264_23445, partial [Hyphomicrobiaceae bacterium]|nr:hypothetical protein [Hyphomicrobiaceae bacterium]
MSDKDRIANLEKQFAALKASHDDLVGFHGRTRSDLTVVQGLVKTLSETVATLESTIEEMKRKVDAHQTQLTTHFELIGRTDGDPKECIVVVDNQRHVVLRDSQDRSPSTKFRFA